MHDYQPEWDYHVVSLTELKQLSAPDRVVLEREVAALRRDLAPAVGLSAALEVFFVQPHGLDRYDGEGLVGIFCCGTASRPVIGLDTVHLHQECHAQGLDFAQQVRATLAHELAHAWQEASGVEPEDGDSCEDAAEAFAREWAVHGRVDLGLAERPGRTRRSRTFEA